MPFSLSDVISVIPRPGGQFEIGLTGGGTTVQFGTAASLCGLLPEGTLRDACFAAAAAFGGGNGTGIVGSDPGGFPCIWPARVDPVTQECKVFVGSQEGADPGKAVVGAFGLPALVPAVVGQIMKRDGSTGPILRCRRTMVLGTDNLCYPKAVLPRRSKFRKWRGQVRPAVSAGDVKAIRRAAAARDRVLILAKEVGLHASKTKPKTAPRAHQHLLAAPPQQLHVVSEHTD